MLIVAFSAGSAEPWAEMRRKKKKGETAVDPTDLPESYYTKLNLFANAISGNSMQLGRPRGRPIPAPRDAPPAGSYIF
jgi:hypothetical protein